jgi:hypothetical protein
VARPRKARRRVAGSPSRSHNRASVEQGLDTETVTARVSRETGRPCGKIAMENQEGKPSSWAQRLADELLKRGDIELEPDVKVDDIVFEMMAVLDDHGEAALVKREACDELADALAEMDGVVDLYISEVELQELLRQTAP